MVAGVGNACAGQQQQQAEMGLRVVVVVDTTGSMGSYCTSLSDTLPQIFSVLRVLMVGRAQVDIVAYEDYCDGDRLCRFCYGGEEEAMAFAKQLRAGGGGDHPEASKTALNEVVTHLRAADRGHTIVLFYTDAPPHTSRTGGGNRQQEVAALQGADPGHDWMAICRALDGLGAHTYTFVPNSNDVLTRYHALLGPVVRLPNTDPATITRATMGVLLQLMGQEFPGADAYSGSVVRFVSGPPMEGLTEARCGGYLTTGVEAADPNVDQLMQMGFGEADVREALRMSRGNREAAVELLVSAQVTGSGAQGLVSLERGDMRFEALEGWRRDLNTLVPLFTADAAFQDQVFRTLRELITPERPERALALTYNRVVGLLWRLACRRREDERLGGLAEALGKCVTLLSGEKQASLRAWIDESYDQTAEVCEMIQAVGVEGGVLVLDRAAAPELPSKDDMRSLVHAPTPSVLAAVQKLLTSAVLVSGEEAARVKLPRVDGDDEVPLWVPVGLGDKDLFSVLPHLALPGLLVTLRPACIMAILAYLSGNVHLKQRAAALLERVKGKWIPAIAKLEDYPEILAAGFAKLVSRVPEFLTEEEAALYAKVARVVRVRNGQNLRVEVACGYRPHKERLYFDDKVVCTRCGVERSASLVVGGVCGLCLDPERAGHPNEEPQEAGRSHLVECRTCTAIYAVVNVQLLNVEPKCWYCRKGKPAPTVSCSGCRNRFVRPDRDGGAAAFTCQECIHRPHDAVHTEEAVYSRLQAENPALYGLLGFSPAHAEALASSMSVYKLWNKHPEVFAAAGAGDGAAAALPEVATWRKHEVLNLPAVADGVRQRMSQGELTDVCNLCFEDVAVAGLESACGNCDNVACRKCLRAWYASLQPGCMYTPTLGLCPFCKRRPTGSMLSRYNKRACAVVTSRKNRVEETALRADMCYGWCAGCYKVKEAFPKVCGAHVDAAKVKGFRCTECVEAEGQRRAAEEAAGDPEARTCPSCAAPTVKADGCNHMTCLCGCDWCWECGGDYTNADIYEHMEEAHGGIGVEY